MRRTDFWERMGEVFGPAYANSVAKDQVLPQLGGRTIQAALADGVDVQTIWRAVVAQYGDRVPPRLR
jgi:Protein of unknown function (DUF3046)